MLLGTDLENNHNPPGLDSEIQDFSLSKVGVVKLGRPADTKWARSLHFVTLARKALLAAAGVAGFVTVDNSGIVSIAAVEPFMPMPSYDYVYQSPNLTEFTEISPDKQPRLKENEQLRRAYDSTVALAAFDRTGDMLYIGSGTVLSGTEVWGRPAIVTVRHVTLAPGLARSESFMVAFDNSGHYIGSVKPLIDPEATDYGVQDPPVLLAIDRRFPVNDQVISKIPGVEVASTVGTEPQYVQFGGKGYGAIGAAPGDSGGGVFVEENGEYRLTAVISQVTRRDLGGLVKLESPAILPGAGLGNAQGGRDYASVPSKTVTIVSPIGQMGFQTSLAEMAHYNGSPKRVRSIGSDNLVGFGFGEFVAGMLQGHTKPAWKVKGAGLVGMQAASQKALKQDATLTEIVEAEITREMGAPLASQEAKTVSTFSAGM
jgi:hypothetical protein